MRGEAALKSHAEPRALAALIAGAVLIGFAPIFVRLADVGYTAAAFWRVALALPVLAMAWLGSAGFGPRHGSFARVRWLLLAGLFFACDLGVWHQSIRYTSVANSTLFANFAPIFVTAGSVWLFRDHVNRRFLLGLGVALLGSALIVAHSFRVSLATVGGDALGVLAAVFYAAYLLTVSRQRKFVSALDVMWWSTLACALALLPIVLALGEPLWPQSAHGWWVLLGLALVSHVAGQGLIAWGMAHLSAAFSSVSLLVQPVAAAVFAWLLLGEAFGALQALGGLVVLGGILACRLAMTRS